MPGLNPGCTLTRPHALLLCVLLPFRSADHSQEATTRVRVPLRVPSNGTCCRLALRDIDGRHGIHRLASASCCCGGLVAGMFHRAHLLREMVCTYCVTLLLPLRGDAICPEGSSASPPFSATLHSVREPSLDCRSAPLDSAGIAGLVQVVAAWNRTVAGLRSAHQPLGRTCMEMGSDPVPGPGDSYRLVATGRSLGEVAPVGTMDVVRGGRLMESWLVAPHLSWPTQRRGRPRNVKFTERTPYIGETTVWRTPQEVGVGRGARGSVGEDDHIFVDRMLRQCTTRRSARMNVGRFLAEPDHDDPYSDGVRINFVQLAGGHDLPLCGR